MKGLYFKTIWGKKKKILLSPIDTKKSLSWNFLSFNPTHTTEVGH